MIKNISFNLPVLITKQNKSFVAYTPALDLSTSGKTENEVKKRFVELANIFLEEIIEAKTVNEVLSELGWTKVQKKWTPPKVISSQSIGLSIPALA
jgi:predicted RNase H-like HicB family nuclease